MSFYLKAPRGHIHLEKLRDLASKRLRVLHALDSSAVSLADTLKDCVNDAECVQEEGTAKDRVSHFVLQMAAAGGASASRGFRDFFVSREKELFRLRLANQETEEKRLKLLELRRHLRERLRCGKLLPDLVAWHEAVNKLIENNLLLGQDVIPEDDDDAVTIPFHLVPDLVSQRAVTISHGMAIIKASVLDAFLVSAFEYFLLDSLMLSVRLPDQYENVEVLLRELLDYYRTLRKRREPFPSDDLPRIQAVDVEAASKDSFPPCFASVQQKLVRSHRLQHSARFGYSLFLKEIGLSRDEALNFWSWHYSNPCGASSGCSHSWQADHRKFTYSINHVYGLAGGRKNYSAHACSSIQRRCHSPTEQLVCPFKAFDREELARSLDPTGANLDGILEEATKENFSCACKMYLASKCNRAVIDVPFSETSKPSDFYKIALMRGPS